MSTPTRSDDKANLDELMAIMKGGENTRTIDSIADKIKKTKMLLRWVDKDGLNALQVGIVAGCSGEKVSALLVLDPALAKERLRGRLPLHMALEHNPREDVLDRLIDAYPHALEIRDPNDGRLPLHLILEHQPFPAQFVQLGMKVLQRYPEAAHVPCHDKLPLQICLENGLRPMLTLKVIQAFRSAACVASAGTGKLPLHLAVEQNLDPRVIDALIEANPGALIAKMAGMPGSDTVVLEYAIRQRRAALVIQALMKGGKGKHPKALAYARAAAVGRLTKEMQTDKRSGRAQKEGDLIDPDSTPANRRRLQFYVQPFAGDQISIDMEPTDKVAHLKRRIQDIEGTPADRMRLTKDGQQMMDGYDLTHYGLTKGCKVEMRQRFEILQQALRHEAGKEATLQLLEMRPMAAQEDDQHGALPLELGLLNNASEDVILKLLEQYPEAAKKPCASGGDLGEYPLHVALRQGASERIVKKLVEGCSKDDWEETGVFSPGRHMADGCHLLPLHMAIQSDVAPDMKSGIIDLLLHSRCPIDARDPVTGYSALDVVLSTQPIANEIFLSIYQKLLEVRPKIAEEPGKNGQRPLHIAVVHNAGQAIIDKLCTVAPSVLTTYDVDLRLPIHLAVSCGASFAVVKSLLAHNRETLLKTDGQGKTPLQLAVSHNAQPGVVFEICRTDRKTLDVRDMRGRSLLELALSNDAPQWVIQELLEASPGEVSNLNLLSGKWPNTKASSEALRFAFEARKRSAQMGKGAGKGKHPSSMMAGQRASSPNRSMQPPGSIQSSTRGPAPAPSRGPAPSTQEPSEQDESVLTTVGRWFGF